MPTNTINLGLKTYNSTTDASATFVTYRSDQAGISPTSNMNLIDSWVGSANASLLSLAQLGLHYVRGNYISANYYEATSTDLSAYATNIFISLSLNTDSDGSVGLNINGLGTKYLKRYDINGNLIGFEVGELKKNREYTFRYDGTYWVLVSSNLADQISASGINQHLIMISPCGVLIDSGLSASSISASSVIAYGEDGDLLMISGSGEYARIADSGISTYDLEYISTSMIAFSTGSYVVLELNSDLHNEWLLTAGSGISIIKDNSASTIAIKNNFFVDQSGSSVKTYGLISGSINGSNCDFTVSNQKFDSGTLLVYLNGQLQTQGSDDDWVETSASLGVFSFVTAPLAGDKIICHYTSKG